ncbi:hypothetical protein K466DRAFT_315651 [Polyporus arcularius HHB13444]|uniref:Uncharacterized protein n=1 Tax=Polyporus arcularius HHB13444 TaxID=1314778 RepID=A0A5C3P8A5_9APHY|nr:hypothetical protein K466DRAFT_315651 [Polyporus arcularius HHB13444]
MAIAVSTRVFATAAAPYYVVSCVLCFFLCLTSLRSSSHCIMRFFPCFLTPCSFLSSPLSILSSLSLSCVARHLHILVETTECDALALLSYPLMSCLSHPSRFSFPRSPLSCPPVTVSSVVVRVPRWRPINAVAYDPVLCSVFMFNVHAL